MRHRGAEAGAANNNDNFFLKHRKKRPSGGSTVSSAYDGRWMLTGICRSNGRYLIRAPPKVAIPFEVTGELTLPYHALFKMVRYDLLRPLRPELDVIQNNCRVRFVGISQYAVRSLQ
jgi:hypothetical protein